MTRRTRFLVIEHPAIAAQWHPDLNADLDLAQIGPGSHKAVFWRCDEVDGRWIRWTSPIGDADVQFDAFTTQHPSQNLATWTVWAGLEP
ncbi:zinc-ribbon domain-containing protein [Streptomyces hirsutus]|uniref:zinc-ribbon domain-containing protein n=1 Tax=Streptomyces hirsutus TaxID=35620 RepID=UPI0036C8CBE4